MPTYEFLNREAKFSPFQNYPKSTGAVKIMASLDTSTDGTNDDGKCYPGEFMILNSSGNFERVCNATREAKAKMGNLYIAFDGNADKIGHYYDAVNGQNISNGVLSGSAMGLGSNFVFKLARISGTINPGDRCTVKAVQDSANRWTSAAVAVAKPANADAAENNSAEINAAIDAVRDYAEAPMYCNGIAEDGAYLFTII